VSISTLGDLSLSATTEIKAFDSKLTITCGSGKHQLIVGLDGLDDSMNSENDVIDNNQSRGCPKTHTVLRIVQSTSMPTL